jgi:hypothetical protein
METKTDRMVEMMPFTSVERGASGGWKASGARAPMAPPVHEGTVVPTAGDASSWAHRDRQSLALINPFTNDVPGTRPWSPPA